MHAGVRGSYGRIARLHNSYNRVEHARVQHARVQLAATALQLSKARRSPSIASILSRSIHRLRKTTRRLDSGVFAVPIERRVLGRRVVDLANHGRSNFLGMARCTELANFTNSTSAPHQEARRSPTPARSARDCQSATNRSSYTGTVPDGPPAVALSSATCGRDWGPAFARIVRRGAVAR